MMYLKLKYMEYFPAWKLKSKSKIVLCTLSVLFFVMLVNAFTQTTCVHTRGYGTHRLDTGRQVLGANRMAHDPPLPSTFLGFAPGWIAGSLWAPSPLPSPRQGEHTLGGSSTLCQSTILTPKIQGGSRY